MFLYKNKQCKINKLKNVFYLDNDMPNFFIIFITYITLVYPPGVARFCYNYLKRSSSLYDYMHGVKRKNGGSVCFKNGLQNDGGYRYNFGHKQNNHWEQEPNSLM